MGSLWQGRGRASTGHTANQPAGREHHLSEEIRWGSRGASAAAATPEENPIHAMAAGHGAARPWGACGRGELRQEVGSSLGAEGGRWR
jgi:hypothetical protein